MMLYDLIGAYIDTNSVNSIREYMKFIEKELRSKLFRLFASKILLVIVFLLTVLNIWYGLYVYKFDVLFILTMGFVLIADIIILSNVNNRIHYVNLSLELTLNTTRKIPLLNVYVSNNDDVKTRLILNLNHYFVNLASYVDLTNKETFQKFKQHSIHSLI